MKCEQCGNSLLTPVDAAAMFGVFAFMIAVVVAVVAYNFRARDLEHQEILRKLEREQGVVKLWERPR